MQRLVGECPAVIRDLGLIWPAFFVSLGKVRRVQHGEQVKLLAVGGIVLWLLYVMLMLFATNMKGIVNAYDSNLIPNPCAWLPLAYRGAGWWYKLFQLVCDALPATLFFQGGWLASGGEQLAGTLPLALAASERPAARSLLVHSVLYWGKLIVVTCWPTSSRAVRCTRIPCPPSSLPSPLPPLPMRWRSRARCAACWPAPSAKRSGMGFQPMKRLHGLEARAAYSSRCSGCSSSRAAW